MMKTMLAALLLTSVVHASAKIEFYDGGLKPEHPAKKEDFKPVVEISGMRGEILNFALKVSGVEKCVEPKMSVKGSAISLVRFFEMPLFVTSKPSYKGARVGAWFDPLVEKKKICGSIKHDDDSIWMLGEFKIAETSAAGTFEGEVKAGDLKIPLKLRVYPMQMPDRFAMPLYSELTTWFLLLGHYGKWHEGEEELAKKYARKMIEHRVLPLKNWVRGLELNAGVVSLNDFEKNVSSLLPEWAMVCVNNPASMAADEKTAKYFSALKSSLADRDLLNRSFLYLWDEPQKSQLEEIRKLSPMIRKQAPGLKIMVTTTWKKELEDAIDIFVPVLEQFDRSDFPPVGAYKELQKKGKQFWLYNSCMSHGCGNDYNSGTPDWVIDRPGVYIRSYGWMGHHYGANALLYYSVDNFYQKYPDKHDPWTDQWDFTGNGDGNLFYPGRPGMQGLTNHEPVESLRLKLWRQSSYDVEYLKMFDALKEKPENIQKKLGGIVRSTVQWEKSDRTYSDLRKEIGEFLTKKTVN